eukprot:scaffold150545_cov22-Prasinocladus_malaysianus.AAC.1
MELLPYMKGTCKGLYGHYVKLISHTTDQPYTRKDRTYLVKLPCNVMKIKTQFERQDKSFQSMGTMLNLENW